MYDRCNTLLCTLQLSPLLANSKCATNEVATGIINEQQHHSDKSDDTQLDDDNSSYLDMSLRKYESYKLKQAIDSNPNEYVDIIGKKKSTSEDTTFSECADDDNIYDNYVVERKLDNSGSDVPVNDIKSNGFDVKHEFPFSGLPATHLPIKKAKKIGWLTLNQRRRRFLNILHLYLNKKFYVGLISDDSGNGLPDWWLLLYGGGATDLKPSLFIHLSQFELSRVTKNIDKKKSFRKSAINNFHFELKEKPNVNQNTTSKFDPIVYQFSTSSSDEFEQWYSILMMVNNDTQMPTDLNASGSSRKLPMLPPSSSHKNILNSCDETDVASNAECILSDNLIYTNQDLPNYSEGVYEEPEEFYKSISKPVATSSPLPPHIPSKSNTQKDTNEIDADNSTYDIPISPARSIYHIRCNENSSKTIKHLDNRYNPNVDKADDYDRIMVSSVTPRIVSTTENKVKISEIRTKLTSQFKEHSQKYLSVDNATKEMTISATNSIVVPNSSTTNNYNNKSQLNTVRKFVNQLTRIKRSSMASKKSATHTSQKINKITDENVDKNIKSIYSAQPKGKKVHMIINQLEANGQLPLLSGGVGSSTGCNRNSISLLK